MRQQIPEKCFAVLEQNGILLPSPWRLHHAQPGRQSMQQIKIFKGLEGEIAALEKQVNTWLAESGARVLQITGNIAAQGGSTDPKASSLSA